MTGTLKEHQELQIQTPMCPAMSESRSLFKELGTEELARRLFAELILFLSLKYNEKDWRQ